MKYLVLFISLIFHTSFLISEVEHDVGLPQELIYHGRPVDPKALLNIANHGGGDYSKHMEDIDYKESQEKQPLIKVLEKEFVYDQNKVVYQEHYQICATPSQSEAAVYEGEYTNHFSYEYLGSTGNNHILKTLKYDTSGHGNDLQQLLVLTKDASGMLNANIMTAGNHKTGFSNVYSINKNYLTYGEIRFFDDFMDPLFIRDEVNCLAACCSSTSIVPFEVLYKYDLEKFEAEISGLVLPDSDYVRTEFDWDFESTHQENDFFAWALNEVLKEYHQQGKRQLDL